VCAISGFYCYGEARPHVNTIKGLMLAAQTRGTSACGMAYMNAENTIMIRKQEGPAKNLVEAMSDAQWAEVARSPRALLHARATTKGSEKENKNNHPVSAYGWVAVHNGHINNDDDLFKYYKADRYADVDTAAIPLVLSQGKDYEDSLKHLSILAGQATVALWSLATPEKIALARIGGNDLYIFLDPSRDIVYWCSTPLGGRAIPGYSLGNMAFFTVGKLHEDKVMVLEPTTEKVRLLKLGQRPFFPKRSYTPWTPDPRVNPTPNGGVIIGGVKALPMPASGTPSTGTICKSVKAITHGKEKRMFEWIQRNKLWQDKPTIDSGAVASNWFDWKDSVDYFREKYKTKGNMAETRTLFTAYGRWMFQCPSTAQPEKFNAVFHPARRIKKYWRRYYSSQIPDNKLPAVLGRLDGIMTLEEFSFVETTNTTPPGTVHYLGWLCPWCGIMMKTIQWNQLACRCPCCGTVSQPYRKEDSNVDS